MAGYVYDEKKNELTTCATFKGNGPFKRTVKCPESLVKCPLDLKDYVLQGMNLEVQAAIRRAIEAKVGGKEGKVRQATELSGVADI